MGKVKHGILHYISSGEIHPSIRKRESLSRELDRIKGLAIEQTPDMNIKKELLINDAIFCQGIIDLALLYINKAGLFEQRALKRDKLELQPIIKCLAQFMNTKRLNLLAVNLTSKADETLDVQAYIKQFDKKKEAKAKAKK